MSSRRIFIQRSASTVGALWLAPSFFFDRRSDLEIDELALGLFFDGADLARMRSIYETDDAFRSLKRRLNSVNRGELRRFMAEDVRYNDQLFHIVRLSDAAQQMALHYVLTGDRDAAQLAAECIRSIMQFERWDYFLEAGKDVVGIQRASSTLIAVAVCSDWLGDFIDNEERSEWLSVMKERGCETCFRSVYGMRYPETVVGWTRDEASTYFEHRPGDRPTDLSQRHIILDSTNLKAVPASALAIGAAAYMRHFGEDDDTARWFEQAVFSLKTFGEFFTADGSYHEGVSYANYTALNILKATSVLKRFDVADLTELINWTGYADFAVGMAMPTDADPYEVVNFGDNGNAKTGTRKPLRTAVSLWVGANFHDPRAQWFGLNRGGEHDEWALIWYDPAVAVQAPDQGPQLWHSDLDWIVARTGFKEDDLTVAMRSGGPGNHEHADRNSIIVKCFGEQLVVDPYRPPYSYTDPAWMMRTTAGHSAVLVDGRGHQYHDGTEGTNPSDARARIIRKSERKLYCHWTSDATDAYQLVNEDILGISRSVLVLYEQAAIIIFDKVRKAEKDSLLQARFFGFNHDNAGVVEAAGDAFTISRPKALLAGIGRSAAGATAASMHLPIPEKESFKHPFAELSTITPSLQPSLLTVISATRRTPPRVSTTVEYEDGVYKIELKKVGGGTPKSVHCKVYDTGLVPEFEVTL